MTERMSPFEEPLNVERDSSYVDMIRQLNTPSYLSIDRAEIAYEMGRPIDLNKLKSSYK
jgi:hypothetical protein